MSYHASNPGKVIPNPLVWFRYFKGLPLVLILVIVVGIAGLLLAPADSPHMVRFRLMPLAGLVLGLAGWGMLFRHSYLGDASPGIILSADSQPTIAVLVNMSKGGGSAYAIKIRAIKVMDESGSQLAEGTRIAAMCEYADTNANKDRSRWGDVDGVPVNCYTADPGATERLLAAYSEEDWDFLESALRSLPSHKPGIYFLNDIEATARG